MGIFLVGVGLVSVGLVLTWAAVWSSFRAALTSRSIRSMFFDHTAVKLLALGIGISLYFLVRTDSIKELEVEVPVAVSGLRDDVVLTGDIPSSIRVRLRGRWSRLLRVLERRPAPYELSIAALADGEMHRFDEAHLRQLIGASSLDISTLEPPGVLVRLEPRISRRVPVRLDFAGEVSEGFEFDPELVRFRPVAVEISGPKSSVEAVDSVSSSPIQLAGLSRDLQADVVLQRPDRPHVTLQPDRVSVQVPIRERVVDDELVAVRIYVRNCAPLMRCMVAPTHVRVRVRGSIQRLRDLKDLGEEQMVYVDVFQQSQKPGTYTDLPLEVKRFEGIRFEVEPSVVNLEVGAISFPIPIPQPLLPALEGPAPVEMPPIPGGAPLLPNPEVEPPVDQSPPDPSPSDQSPSDQKREKEQPQ